MASLVAFDNGLNLKATELRLGLPGADEVEQEIGSSAKSSKRTMPDQLGENEETKKDVVDTHSRSDSPPPAKAQIVGWPPVRSYRKNSIQAKKAEADNNRTYVKVSMDGVPYLRKIDIKGYKGYKELLKALEDMFKLKFAEYSEREGYKGSEYAPAYEDGDGDLMLVGDVPWDMFMSSCKRLRIMKGSEAKVLGCEV